MSEERDPRVKGVVYAIRGKAAKTKCLTCGTTKESNHFLSNESEQVCRRCSSAWTPEDIRYEGTQLKTVSGRSTTRLLGIH